MISILSTSSFSFSKDAINVNQDRVLPLKRTLNGYLVAVADGVGGYEGGSYASELAIHELEQENTAFNRSDAEMFFVGLRNKMIEKSYENSDLSNAATTLTFCSMSEHGLLIGHCGDSRLYIKSGSKLCQITKDQTQHQILIDKGLYTARQLRKLMGGNVLTSAISAKLNLEYQITEIPVSDLPLDDGELIIYAMSDGAHYYWEERPRFSIGTLKSPARFCASLQKRIESKGAHDDYSLVCIKVKFEKEL